MRVCCNWEWSHLFYCVYVHIFMLVWLFLFAAFLGTVRARGRPCTYCCAHLMDFSFPNYDLVYVKLERERKEFYNWKWVWHYWAPYNLWWSGSQKQPKSKKEIMHSTLNMNKDSVAPFTNSASKVHSFHCCPEKCVLSWNVLTLKAHDIISMLVHRELCHWNIVMCKQGNLWLLALRIILPGI